jgi:hypothetical protein
MFARRSKAFRSQVGLPHPAETTSLAGCSHDAVSSQVAGVQILEPDSARIGRTPLRLHLLTPPFG